MTIAILHSTFMLMKTFVFLGPQWQKNPIHIVILDAKIFHNHAWHIIEEN